MDYRINAGYSALSHSGDDGYRIDAMVNLPLADNFAVRLSAFSAEEGGFPQSEIDKVAALIHYEGDQLDTFELGAKIGFAGGRAQVIASAYYQDWKDMISEFIDPTIAGFVQQYHGNAGAANSKGL